MLRAEHVGKKKVIVFIKPDGEKIGYNRIRLLYLKRGKLHEYEMLGLSSILVKISLHGNATTGLF